jgi:hypothetical protein
MLSSLKCINRTLNKENLMRLIADGRYLLSLQREFSTDRSKLTKSDEVKYHSVNHYAVEKTPITAQLWMQRTRDQNLKVGTSTSDQPVNSYVSKGPITLPNSTPTFLLDKTAKESRLTIRYKFSDDGNIDANSIS